ncbi:outer dynein arm-docking complex subunit 4-like isoform X1 [Xyrauchen texanus]|uniref:outer dynein arm-docking complex subunit 4-like isoform X1 n=1 Tax=Xyrauchen texanus TaxID=154827 RepID=UPI002241A7AF|nr:outer dynein arm-docking complex subunit 4-like isoform X1 [Xyrauchen texanus]
MFENGEEQGPKSTFTTYMAEGDQLFHKGEYVKATESFSAALSLQPGEKTCLVARSKCYVKLGDAESALNDAEASLKDNKDFFKGLYQKAEALYTMGDFEFALVYYHRGHKLRPELQEFRLGIQKAQEAIGNSVGSPSSVKLETKGDLAYFHKSIGVRQKHFIDSHKKEPRQHGQKMPKRERTAKQLLGELYRDREYLEKLLQDEDLIKGKIRTGERVQDLIEGCISYLDTRTEFWQQQKPIYARQRDRKLMQQQWSRALHKPPSDPTRHVLTSLEEIDTALSAGKAESSLKKARELMKAVQGWTDGVLPNKKEVIGNLHSCIGNALMDLGKMDKALNHHKKDLELAKQGDLMDSKSRALDNIGRVYARIGKFQQAIEVWEEKVPLVCSGLEKAWLFHEIGCCYLELKRYIEARDYGSRSLAAADDIRDGKWQLNASVLVAQVELKLGNNKASVLHFERALDRAKLMHDDSAREAIQKALREARQKVTQ